jgi:hypothetical protein
MWLLKTSLFFIFICPLFLLSNQICINGEKRLGQCVLADTSIEGSIKEVCRGGAWIKEGLCRYEFRSDMAKSNIKMRGMDSGCSKNLFFILSQLQNYFA